MHLLEQNALGMQQNHPMKMKCHFGEMRKQKFMFIVVFEIEQNLFRQSFKLIFKIDGVFEDGVSAPGGCSSLLNEHTPTHTHTYSCANIIHVYQHVQVDRCPEINFCRSSFYRKLFPSATPGTSRVKVSKC